MIKQEKSRMSKVCVIGGGPAGMFAAIAAAEKGHRVSLYEKNEKLGKKLFITGKGRCNVTNACDTAEIFDKIPGNPKFLYSAIYGYDNFRVMDFFENHGVPLKIERGERVFPQSDHSSDIIKALEKELKKQKVEVKLNAPVKKLLIEEGKVKGILNAERKEEFYDSIVLATGGISYPQTGSTGDGYDFAKECGHTIVEAMPSLVPIVLEEKEYLALQGLSLRNVSLMIQNGKKKKSYFGEMLFTHFGISGPLVLTISAEYGNLLAKGKIKLELDLKPALSEKQLDQRLQRDFEKYINKDFRNALSDLLPAKMIPLIVEKSDIEAERKIHDITKEERNALGYLIKHLPMTASGVRGISEAIITKGGVSVKNIDASTMESKIIQNLYFAGELIDVDALTGGYNLQIAWSTGYLAGNSIK
jgi:predicted Rossmann fold flavoprotein